MGKVRFWPEKNVEQPFQARTGELVQVRAYVVNDDPWGSCDHCKLEIRVSSDSEGKHILWTMSGEFDACSTPLGNVTRLEASFTMPSYDIWLGYFLYHFKDNQWVLVDSTAFLGIDNPAWPPPLWGFWNWKFLGIELYKWAILWLSVTLAGVIIVKSR
jgi:hypothetical protein